MEIEKLYEDKDLLVINKPAGLVVHSDKKVLTKKDRYMLRTVTQHITIL